ncbi:TetR-like C-terminal domain-containing protein [Parasphingorhabdus cellanae]|uniref:WHG domain-containing protein n=1 Tax=Parasphingorhabdus cellanae TaxID=2806553 RepID=A0ABX7T1F6_9SPHN|nr:TetR-like C-terminal domain-containing protein [Parasphingorhabdus cellanae]QTD54986.1 WHG domain-containing protein [Parasphingorhabdus cellanae]
MNVKDNSVNIKDVPPVSGTYHHGDLRAAAIAAGMKRIEDMAHPDLGLRALARELGVSATALYRHFPNKDALLDALALEALNRLGKNQAEAGQAAGGGREGFVEVGVIYVQWAVENPALVRLIYDRVGKVDLESDNPSAMGEAFLQLRKGIAALMPDDMSGERRAVAALHAWSLVHGLAMLILDGQVEYDPDMVRKVVGSTEFNNI